MKRLPAVSVFLACLTLSVFLSPWERQLYVGDETKYGQILREMHWSHSLLVPQLGGEPYTHKPPVHFWMIYGLTLVFGLNSVWPFVIPSLLGYLATLWVTLRLSREIFPESSPHLSAFICGSFHLLWALAQTARMDVQFQFFISLAALFLYRFLREGASRQLIACGVSAGLAVLIKGPMAFVVIAVVVLLEWARRRRLPRGPWLLATGIAAALPLAWVIPAILSRGNEFGHELLVKQNVGRAFGAWVHRAPPWFFVLHFPIDFFPWFALIVVALVAGFRDPLTRNLAGFRFCVSWILAVFLPFSLLSSKLDVYMLPATIPCGLILARFVSSTTTEVWRRRGVIANGAVLALFATLGLVVIIFSRMGAASIPEMELIRRPGVQIFLWILTLVPILGLALLLAPGKDKLLRSVLLVGGATTLPLALGALLLIPVANEAASTERLIAALNRQNVTGNDIALFRSPYLWSTDMPEELGHVRYIGERGLTESGPTPPLVVAVQSNRAHWLNPRLEQEYRKVDEVKMKGKPFAIYRRH